VNRRAAIASVVVVTIVFVGVRHGVRLLARPTSSAELKDEARQQLRFLATEARETRETKATIAAFAAEDAIGKERCDTAKGELARADEAVAKDSRARGAFESARRAVDAYCATLTR
jgi:hypothetical protein